jgi:hypothetical protein
MSKLSVTTAWNETTAFVRREAQLLFPLAFLLVSIPAAVLQLVTPEARPGEIPEAGVWVLVLPAAMLLSMMGSVAICYLVLRPNSSVGEAMSRALRRLPTIIGALLVLIAGGVLVSLVAGIVIGALAVAGGGATPQASPLAMFLVALLIVALLLLWVRLLLITPIAAQEEGGPIQLLRRSWRLTAGRFWKLVGLVLLTGLVVGVLSLAISGVLGSLIILLLGQPDRGTVSGSLILLLGAIVNCVVVVFFTVLLARIYAQLAGQVGDGTSGT